MKSKTLPLLAAIAGFVPVADAIDADLSVDLSPEKAQVAMDGKSLAGTARPPLPPRIVEVTAD